MKLAAKTDIGSVRSENQDNYRASQRPGGDAWALVCDGMGGARGLAPGWLTGQLMSRASTAAHPDRKKSS